MPKRSVDFMTDARVRSNDSLLFVGAHAIALLRRLLPGVGFPVLRPFRVLLPPRADMVMAYDVSDKEAIP